MANYRALTVMSFGEDKITTHSVTLNPDNILMVRSPDTLIHMQGVYVQLAQIVFKGGTEAELYVTPTDLQLIQFAIGLFVE
jgi:hypothetical protein